MVKSLSPLEIKKVIDSNENVKLIDVREPWEFEIGKIENAELIPLSNFAAGVKKLNPKDTIIVYCHHGVRSLRACEYLNQLNFENVINLNGGIEAWSQEVDSSVPFY